MKIAPGFVLNYFTACLIVLHMIYQLVQYQGVVVQNLRDISVVIQIIFQTGCAEIGVENGK